MPSLTDTIAGQRQLERSPSRRPAPRAEPWPPRRRPRAPCPGDASAGRAPRRPGSRPGSRRCRPTRCRTGSGRTGRWRPPGRGSRRRSRPPSRPGPSRRPSVSSRIARSIPIAIASRSCSSASAGPSVRTAVAAALRLDDPDGLLDRALLVRADREAEVAGVDVLAVGGQEDPAAGRGHALDADEDVHRRQSDAGVLGIEQRRRAGDRDGDRIALAEVLDEELAPRRARGPAAGTPSGGASRPTAPSPPTSRTSRGPSRRRSARRRGSGSARGRACSA